MPEDIRGLDYVEAWLTQLLVEAQFLARFDAKETVAYLDAWCPAYCGLLINVYDPIYEAWREGRMAMATHRPDRLGSRTTYWPCSP